MTGSMAQTVTFGNSHNISSAEEKVDNLKSESSMREDLSVLSIRSISSAVARTASALCPRRSRWPLLPRRHSPVGVAKSPV
jgi:hypothetical protein